MIISLLCGSLVKIANVQSAFTFLIDHTFWVLHFNWAIQQYDKSDMDTWILWWANTVAHDIGSTP